MKNKGKSMLAVAMTVFIMAGVVVFTPTKATAEDTSEIKVGDHVYFGINAAYDSKPILWRVMEIDTANNTATLLSEYILENRAYDTSNSHNDWSGSIICGYLNGDFFNNSFNLAEQADIRTYGTTDTTGRYASIDIRQKVVLPSVAEAERWFTDDAQRKATHVDSTKTSIGDTYWWLRSPGDRSFNAAFVYDVGRMFPVGLLVYYNKFGVRPLKSRFVINNLYVREH